jgi:hypothetical protein
MAPFNLHVFAVHLAFRGHRPFAGIERLSFSRLDDEGDWSPMRNAEQIHDGNWNLKTKSFLVLIPMDVCLKDNLLNASFHSGMLARGSLHDCTFREAEFPEPSADDRPGVCLKKR